MSELEGRCGACTEERGTSRRAKAAPVKGVGEAGGARRRAGDSMASRSYWPWTRHVTGVVLPIDVGQLAK
jgi:hypothetical protein